MDSQNLQEITKDPEMALAFAKAYKKEGKLKEALEMHEWFHFNALSIKSSLYGVRLSYALFDWLKLAEIYPEAKQKLIEIRDKKVKKIKNGSWEFNDFHDVEAISERLKDDKISIELFKLICVKETDKNKVIKCFDIMLKVLVDNEELELLDRCMGDPLAQVSKYINEFKENEASGKEYIKRMGESEIKKKVMHGIQEAPKRLYVNRMLPLVGALKLLNQNEDIEEVYKVGKGVIPDEEYQKIFESRT